MAGGVPQMALAAPEPPEPPWESGRTQHPRESSWLEKAAWHPASLSPGTAPGPAPLSREGGHPACAWEAQSGRWWARAERLRREGEA
jgi:hypothetical protein